MGLEKLRALKAAYESGQITWEALEEVARPIVDGLNAQAAEIAKRHGKKPHRFTLGYLLRNSKLGGR